jgi:hypothetical protein
MEHLLERPYAQISVLRKDKLCMEKPVSTQKLVLKRIQICVAATQICQHQARFQHKSDFTLKNFVCMVLEHQQPGSDIQG